MPAVSADGRRILSGRYFRKSGRGAGVAVRRLFFYGGVSQDIYGLRGSFPRGKGQR
jgi:hypothetical protein